MSARVDIFETSLGGLRILQRNLIQDHRGYLERMFCAQELEAMLSNKRIAQINHSLTRKAGSVRGMHFQYPPHAETKIVSCLAGEVFDVAVDLRQGSPTFLQWHGEILSSENHRSLLIPEGFAHGFQTLRDDCEMLYLHTAPWTPGSEGGLQPGDPALNIQWPKPITEISPRDSAFALVTPEFAGVAA